MKNPKLDMQGLAGKVWFRRWYVQILQDVPTIYRLYRFTFNMINNYLGMQLLRPKLVKWKSDRVNGNVW